MSSYDTTTGATGNIAPSGNPDEIRADIERTRSELGDDVTALAGKVDPRTRAKQALGTVKARATSATSRVSTTAPATARQVGQTVRSNPKPAVAAVLMLAGAAVGTLFARRRAAVTRSAPSRWAARSRR